MTDQPPPPGDTSAAAFDLMFLRERAIQCRLTDEDLTALTGIPTADWDTHLTAHTLPAAALFPLARALNTSPESLLLQPMPASRPGPGVATHATVLHAALLEADRIHPDDLASALEWPPYRLKRAVTTLAAHLEQPSSPHRLIHTDTTIHLTCVPGLLDPKQRQNLHNTGHTAVSLAPGEATALTRLLHRTARGLTPDLPAEGIPRLANRRLLAPAGEQPTPHPDVLFALGLAGQPLIDASGPADHPALGHRHAAAAGADSAGGSASARRCHTATTRSAMMPLPRTTTVSETTTGSWKPTWSPGHTRPGLPPLTVVHDPHDDHAFMAAALAAHTPALGRITVHPTPVASAPAALAHDLLRSLGKHLPLAGSEDGTYWTGNTETAWRAVAAWTLALRIGHVIVTRAHRISSRHFEYLFALRELTGIRLTLLCHGPLPPALAAALAALPHEEAHTLAAAHRALGTPEPADRFAWREAGEQFPPHEGEPCFLLPTRRTPGRGHIEAAVRRLGRAVLPLPAAGRFPPEPDEHTALLAHRLHTRIAHPVHAAALAVRIFTGCPATQLQLPAAHKAPPARGPERPAPSWAVDLLEAARRFGQLEGRQHSNLPLRLSPWDHGAVTEAAHACGLHEHQAPGPKRHSAATTSRSRRPTAVRRSAGSTPAPGRAA
ncbi:hypothetical protein [Actinacidiphila soli]|uniref:hypothetical protein n=1 Tax=Actinacidiphila soli TaxID=2487275 RepID=UPI001F0C4011|nr:hypothetical protein [Actinacidiphila soli]